MIFIKVEERGKKFKNSVATLIMPLSELFTTSSIILVVNDLFLLPNENTGRKKK